MKLIIKLLTLLSITIPMYLGLGIADRNDLKHSVSDLKCMMVAMHYEASGEGIEGLRSVYEVVRNRANLYNKSLCDVIKKPHQFSFLNSDKNKLQIELDEDIQWKYLKIIECNSCEVLGNNVYYYHNTSVRPKWASKVKFIKKVNHHKFYGI